MRGFNNMEFDIKDIQERVLVNNINYRLAFREIEINKKVLTRNLNEKQKELVDLIVEHKDAIENIVAKTSFKEGFKLGMKLVDETNRQPPSKK